MGDYGSYQQEMDSTVFSSFKSQYSAKDSWPTLHVVESIRQLHPDKHVTSIMKSYADLIAFAEGRNAKATLIKDGDFQSQRSYSPPKGRVNSGEGKLSEWITFGLYEY